MKTAVAYCHPGTVSHSFAFSLLRLEVAELARTGEPPILLAEQAGTNMVIKARNHLAAQVLETKCEWVLFVDADMGFAHDLLERLLWHADRAERPIVGALCFGSRRHAHDDELQAETFGCFPTVYRWHELEDRVGFEVIRDYPRDHLVEVSATGAACVLVHRWVLEAIRDKFGPHWFDEITHPKGVDGPTTFGEDMSFFIRAAAVDVPVHVHTGIHTSHHKGDLYLTEQTWDREQAQVELVDTSAA